MAAECRTRGGKRCEAEEELGRVGMALELFFVGAVPWFSPRLT